MFSFCMFDNPNITTVINNSILLLFHICLMAVREKGGGGGINVLIMSKQSVINQFFKLRIMNYNSTKNLSLFFKPNVIIQI